MADNKDDFTFSSRLKKIQDELLQPHNFQERYVLLNNWFTLLQTEYEMKEEDTLFLFARLVSINNVMGTYYPSPEQINTALTLFQIDLGKITKKYTNSNKVKPLQ